MGINDNDTAVKPSEVYLKKNVEEMLPPLRGESGGWGPAFGSLPRATFAENEHSTDSSFFAAKIAYAEITRSELSGVSWGRRHLLTWLLWRALDVG